MRFNKDEINDFARCYGFHYDGCPAEAITHEFLVDADRALCGKPSCLPMLPAYIQPKGGAPSGTTVLALDAGGTNLRAALASFDETGAVTTTNLVKAAMPGTSGRLSADAFYDAIAAVCAPLLEGCPQVREAGFCFSYPMHITENGDGVPLPFSKEVDAPEVVGQPVGAGLCAALSRRGIPPPRRVVLLNDTAATLLTGAAQIPAAVPSKLAPDGQMAERRTGERGPVIGLVLGTGFNIAYGERQIPKIGYDSDQPQIIVTEAGNFDFRFQGSIDKEFDAATKNPGAYTAEKASAGAYLGDLNLRVFKRAIEDGLVAFEKQAELLACPALPARDLNAFLHDPLARQGFGSLFAADESDAIAAILYLAGIITERAALITSALTAGAVIKARAGNPLAPVRIAVEGSTYLLYHFLRESFEARLRSALMAAGIHDYVITPVGQASLIGAAVAALS